MSRYSELDAAIREMAGECDEHVYAIGMHLLEMQRDGLYREGGYGTFAQYIAAQAELGERQAWKALRVARDFSRELAAEFGTERCDAFLGYIRATPEEDVPGDIATATIPVASADGSTRRIPVGQATVDQIRAATRLVRPPKPGAPSELESTLTAALSAYPGAGARVTGAGVDLKSLPVGSLCEVFAALSKVLNCSRLQ